MLRACSSLILLALLGAHCGGVAPLPQDAGDARPSPATHSLRFREPGPLLLEPGAQRAVEVELRDGRGPVEGTVQFALVGEALDGSLLPTRAPTRGGTARTTFQAPSNAASLRIRASADGAPDAYLPVSVSARGFGGIAVTTRYTGVRGPEQLEFHLFDRVACSDLARAVPVRSAPPLPPAGGSIDFSGLPAGHTFTVLGEAVGVGGVVARGCVGGIDVTRDATRDVTVGFEDLPLRVEGGYGLHLRLDLGDLVPRAAEAWRRAPRDAVAPYNGEAGFVLEHIAEAVQAQAGSAARAEFDAARDRLRADLEADIARRAASPLAALSHLATDVAAVARSADARGVVIATDDRHGDTTVRVAALGFLLDPLTPDVESDDQAYPPISPMMAESGRVTHEAGDRLRVTLNVVPMPFTLIARWAKATMLGRVGVGSTAEFVRLTLGCEAVEAVVRGATSTCDAACVIAACRRATERLAGTFDGAMVTTGASHVAADIEFSAPAAGRAGTLVVQSTEPAALRGRFRDDASLAVGGVAVLQGL